uniref:EGF-like domain-containing protein n=1 Tax=Strongyloides papillosus TaxID=174720 RepID=A0A0N5CEL3_STREA
MKLHIQFYITIVFFVVPGYCDNFKYLHTREHHAIDSSGLHKTCNTTKFNPCKNKSQCYYTNITSEYFCKCDKCYSGQFCQNKICNLINQKDTMKLNGLAFSDFVYLAIVGITFFLSIICSSIFSWRNDQYDKKIEHGHVIDASSSVLTNDNSIMQDIASSMNLEERKKNIELEDFIINNEFINKPYTDENNNLNVRNNLWDDLKTKLKNLNKGKNNK